MPSNLADFQKVFQEQLTDFYAALAVVAGERVNGRLPLTIGTVTEKEWREVADTNCRIVICSGKRDFDKPYALAVLHSFELKQNGDYNGNLCGRTAKPSPVWIADLGDYQVVTVFGATQNPRQKYLETLRQQTTQQNFVQLWPF